MVRPTAQAAVGTVSLAKLRPLAAGALATDGEVAVLATSGEQWAFAAEAEFPLPGIAAAARVVRARLEVESGTIGIGWLAGDAWVVRASADEMAGDTEIDLVVPAGTPGGKLVFDNWTDGGRPARARLRHIELREPDDQTAARAAIRYLFSSRFVPVPQIEELEQHFKLFADPEALLRLVGKKPILRNFALNIWEFVHGKTELASYPWNIAIPVADVCNARCVFCTSWLDGRKLLDLDTLDLFEPAIRHAVLIGLVGLGEPLAHPQFGELCDRLAAMCDPMANAYTITNGFFLQKWRDQLERINLHSYSISLNAATAETHDEVMGLGRDAFPRIVESIAHLIALGKGTQRNREVLISLVVTRQNLAEIPAFVELGNRLGVARIRLRSLTSQPGLLDGLNYHLLPPYLHPDFERLRASAVAAIRNSQVPVEADPAIWSQKIFPEAVERRIAADPPPVAKREQALRDRERRHRSEHLYHQQKGIFRGQLLDAEAGSEVAWAGNRLHVVTPKAAGAFAVELPLGEAAERPQLLRVEVEAHCEEGRMGLGLLDTKKGEWLDRALLDAGAATAVLQAAAAPPLVHLVVSNGGDGSAACRCSLDAVRATADGAPLAIDWGQLKIHNPADPMDDGSNPLGRVPRFGCKAVYSCFYVDKFFYRVVPCCYMTHVPGFEEVRLDGEIGFAEVWNSPAFVELRRRLKEGPLYGACRRCPEKW